MNNGCKKVMALSVLALVMSVPSAGFAQAQPTDDLRAGFENPPDSAKPRVWWHWLSGNISKEGISKDLEWMKLVGIGGMQMFDGDMGAPQVVERRVNALSEEWKEALHWAASEADRLGLEFAMAAAPGWSETGGPWVRPEQGMKKLVWAQTRLSGGRRFRGVLPRPPVASGPFQGITRRDHSGKPITIVPAYYRDVAVLAWRAPEGDVPLHALKPTLEASVPGLELDALIDGDLERGITLPDPKPDHPGWVSFSFDTAQTMRALTWVGPVGNRFADGPDGRIEASDDGITWRSIRSLTGVAHNPAPQRTFAFPATTARHFRVIFEQPEVSYNPWPRPPGITLGELALVPGARVEQFEDKAGFGVHPEMDAVATPEYPREAVIPARTVLDLSEHLQPDGSLDWTPPPGEWIVLRLGYSPTGATNHPATPEATGPEVDKFNAAHVRSHLDAYLGTVAGSLGPLMGARGLRYLLTDSWEAGNANWTEAMLDEFQTRRGYDLKPWLPVLAGYVVDNAQASDAALWDFRRTLADLIAEHHYGTITRFAREHGMGYYGEAVGAAWPTVADGMLAKSHTDIPMGEFWAMPFGGKPAAFHGVRADEFPADIIETASTAHVYGKSLVAAEALTSSLPLWQATPWNLKWVADKYMAMGVNRLVIHTSPHQPGDDYRPGLTLGPFGQAFTRHETWAGMARPWVDYLARSSFMLQQGVPVADILYFYGEGAPSGVPYRRADDPLDIPGYSLDYVNADALLRLASVKDGRIVFPGGASYKVLVLPPELERMTLPLAEKLRELVAAGAVLLGPKPQGSPSLSFDHQAVRTLADTLWGNLDGRVLTMRNYGKGRVYQGLSPQAVLDAEGLGRDFDYVEAGDGIDLQFAHRRVEDGEIYFISNQSGIGGTVNARFRTSRHKPWLWHADTGAVVPVSYQIKDGHTRIALSLDAYEAVFVVFRGQAAGEGEALPAATVTTLRVLDGNWSLQFPPGLGAPDETQRLNQLDLWSNSEIPGIRYFSGVARYSRALDIPSNWLKENTCIVLDLGAVGELAEVRLNGQSIGVAWKPPYRLDVTAAIRPGSNQLEIAVANTWWNRMVGDAQPGAQAVAHTNATEGNSFGMLAAAFAADTPLMPSGLLGPVSVLRTTGGTCVVNMRRSH